MFSAYKLHEHTKTTILFSAVCRVEKKSSHKMCYSLGKYWRGSRIQHKKVGRYFNAIQSRNMKMPVLAHSHILSRTTKYCDFFFSYVCRWTTKAQTFSSCCLWILFFFLRELTRERNEGISVIFLRFSTRKKSTWNFLFKRTFSLSEWIFFFRRHKLMISCMKNLYSTNLI